MGYITNKRIHVIARVFIDFLDMEAACAIAQYSVLPGNIKKLYKSSRFRDAVKQECDRLLARTDAEILAGRLPVAAAKVSQRAVSRCLKCLKIDFSTQSGQAKSETQEKKSSDNNDLEW